MKYFRLNHRDATEAMQVVWNKQDVARVPRSSFHTSAIGMDASVWTEDGEGEALFREALDAHAVTYEEGDEQQVHAKGFGVG